MLLPGEASKGYGLHWLHSISDLEWQIEIEEIYYGGFSFYNSFLTLSLIDTNYPYIIMPNKTFQVFLGMIKKIDANVSCSAELGVCKVPKPCD